MVLNRGISWTCWSWLWQSDKQSKTHVWTPLGCELDLNHKSSDFRLGLTWEQFALGLIWDPVYLFLGGTTSSFSSTPLSCLHGVTETAETWSLLVLVVTSRACDLVSKCFPLLSSSSLELFVSDKLRCGETPLPLWTHLAWDSLVLGKWDVTGPKGVNRRGRPLFEIDIVHRWWVSTLNFFHRDVVATSQRGWCVGLVNIETWW